jgi:hypothetical protein
LFSPTVVGADPSLPTVAARAGPVDRLSRCATPLKASRVWRPESRCSLPKRGVIWPPPVVKSRAFPRRGVYLRDLSSRVKLRSQPCDRGGASCALRAWVATEVGLVDARHAALRTGTGGNRREEGRLRPFPAPAVFGPEFTAGGRTGEEDLDQARPLGFLPRGFSHPAHKGRSHGQPEAP